MKPVGTILKQSRQSLGISLEKVSKETKIPLKILKNLEKNKLQSLPQEPYCSLYVKDYALFLSLSPQRMVAICRRDLEDLKSTSPLSTSSELTVTPKLTVAVLILATFLLFASYLFYQYSKFQRPPSLDIDWPTTESVVQEELRVEGTTDPQNVVRVNQKPIMVDPEGSFSTTVKLSPGANTIKVEATSLNKKTTTEEKVIGFTSTP